MSEAKHLDEGKLQLHRILSMQGLDDVARVGEYGAKKYGQSNWRGGSEWMRYLGSTVRHVTSFIRNEELDKESGLPHLAHAIYNLLILLEWQKTGRGIDDRYKMEEKEETLLSLHPNGLCPCRTSRTSRGNR